MESSQAFAAGRTHEFDRGDQKNCLKSLATGYTRVTGISLPEHAETNASHASLMPKEATPNTSHEEIMLFNKIPRINDYIYKVRQYF